MHVVTFLNSITYCAYYDESTYLAEQHIILFFFLYEIDNPHFLAKESIGQAVVAAVALFS